MHQSGEQVQELAKRTDSERNSFSQEWKAGTADGVSLIRVVCGEDGTVRKYKVSNGEWVKLEDV